MNEHTDIELLYVYDNLKSILGKFKKTEFARIIGTSKQNINGRMSYNGKLFNNEAISICSYLEHKGLINTDIYKKLKNVKHKYEWLQDGVALLQDANLNLHEANIKYKQALKDIQNIVYTTCNSGCMDECPICILGEILGKISECIGVEK